jgi:hypothetical protein
MIPSQQATATVDLKEDTAIPGTFLNGYEVLNLSEVCWPVRVISIELKGQPASDDDRGRLKDIVWKLRGANKSHCPGLGFVIDIDKTRVAIPATWQIPLPVETSEYCAVLSCMMDADNESALGERQSRTLSRVSFCLNWVHFGRISIRLHKPRPQPAPGIICSAGGLRHR